MNEFVCTIGAFDGVHAGHRSLVKAAVRDALERGCSSLVFTFSQDPARVLFGDRAPKSLLSCVDRVRKLRTLGADKVICVPFDRQTAEMEYGEFVASELESRGKLIALHVGEDFRMGAQGAGTPEALARLGEARGFDVVVEPYVMIGGERVSSTRIRGLLAAGKLDEANELLGHEHFVRGTVIHGRGEATSFGFPTANIAIDPEYQLPAEGVYGGFVEVEGSAWPAAINVGQPRSLDFAGVAGDSFAEASLIGFEGDIYDREVTVRFVKWLRAPRVFETLEDLESTVLGNIAWVRENLA